MRHTKLFANVPSTDHLGFWADQTLRAKSVADFIGLDRREIGRVAGVSSASVRWDQKIPREVLERLTEIAVVCSLVAQFFEGDAVKTKLWFQTRNPLLGNLSPRDMIRYGRYEKLRRFVMDALVESGIPVPAAIEVRIGERESGAPEAAAAP
ncbi:MAG: hypothetical protein ACT4P8_16505 [Betaproteobacteria bacterium]